MTKADLIEKIADNAGLTRKDAKSALDATVAAITEALAAGDKVQLSGLGTFDTKVRAARTCRNPQNPDVPVQVPETVVPVFRAAASLKNGVKK